MIGSGQGLIFYNSTVGNDTVPKRQTFTTDGSTKVFTITSFTPEAINFIEVNGFVMAPSAYSIAGSVITFTDAPATGTMVVHGYEKIRLADLEAATESSGSVVKFDIPRHYGTPSSPITGNITFNFDNAKVGMTQVMCHNDSVAPTLPSEAVVLNGTYATGVDNYITLMYYTNGVVLVSYSQE